MQFAASVSERDRGVKVIDLRIAQEASDAPGTLIRNLEKLVSDLKRVSQNQTASQEVSRPLAASR